MKILILFFLFSSSVFGLTLTPMCLTYHASTGVSDFEPCPGTGTGSGGTGTGSGGTGTGSGGTGTGSGGTGTGFGTWDPNTLSCSNLVAPVANGVGELTCPNSDSTSEIQIPSSEVNPSPSKDDVGCDPSLKESSDCASEQTLKKTNELISESNSKLGAIANAEATTGGLLKGISNTLKDISGSLAGTGGTGNTGNGGNSTGDSGTGTGDSLSSSLKDVSTFSPKMSAVGSCPSPKSFSLMGGSFSISYQPLCDFAVQIRPVVISMAVISALLIVVTAL